MMIGGVIQKIMNEMDPPTYRWFLNKLDKTAMSNPFGVTIATLPLLAMTPYFIVYGFNHWWFAAGSLLWFIGSIITKVTNLPVYRWVGNPKNTDPEELRRQQRKLQTGNTWRAWITLASVILMAAQFNAWAVIIVLVCSAIVTFPLLLLARKYTPN